MLKTNIVEEGTTKDCSLKQCKVKRSFKVDKVGGGDQLKYKNKNGTFGAVDLTQLLTGHLSVMVRYWGDLPPPTIIVRAAGERYRKQAKTFVCFVSAVSVFFCCCFWFEKEVILLPPPCTNNMQRG